MNKRNIRLSTKGPLKGMKQRQREKYTMINYGATENSCK